jgi:glycosyltransferase involved in cell wall biosynthesis
VVSGGRIFLGVRETAKGRRTHRRSDAWSIFADEHVAPIIPPLVVDDPALLPARLSARGATAPVNVGFFTDSYLPRRSGVVRAVEAAARGLRERGHRTYIFAPAYPGFTDVDPDVLRFPSIAQPGHPDFPLAVPYSATHLRAIKGFDLDLVHSHTPFLLGGLGVWVARTLRRPLVFTYHTLYAEYAHYTPLVGDLTRPFVIAYTTAYCNRCDRVLVSVPSLERLLRQYGVRTRIDVVPSVGIEPAEFAHPEPGGVRGWFRIPADAPLLLFVGRLAREKGVPLLLDAMAGLPAKVWLLLVGDGPERRELEAHVQRLGLTDRVVFAGEQDHAHVVDALGASDLFVFPSQTETLGLAVLEAMAAGRAVVAVEGGAVPEIVRDGETGRLVPPEPAALRRAIAELIDAPALRRAMGDRARVLAASRSQAWVVDQLLAVYGDMIAPRNTPAQATV